MGREEPSSTLPASSVSTFACKKIKTRNCILNNGAHILKNSSKSRSFLATKKAISSEVEKI